MSGDAAIGLGVLALIVTYPFGLLAAMWGLGALERWMITPTEHAAEVARLLADEDPDTIEGAVASLLAENADRPGAPVRARTPREVRLRAVSKLNRSELNRSDGN